MKHEPEKENLCVEPAFDYTPIPTNSTNQEVQHAALFIIVTRLVLIADMEPGRAKVWAINDLIADARELLGYVKS